MSNIRIYTKQACAYCAQAKQLLQRKGLVYEEIDVRTAPDIEVNLTAQTGYRTMPQIFINERFIGGFTDLAKLSALGELDYLVYRPETKISKFQGHVQESALDQSRYGGGEKEATDSNQGTAQHLDHD